MKIGVLSDSHRRVDAVVSILGEFKKYKVDFVVHAGDIVLEETMQLLKKSEIPYQAVLGNNDCKLAKIRKRYNLEKEPFYFKINKLKIKLMHYPFYLKPDADIVIYGHTHYYMCNYTKGTLFLNPGEASAKKKNLFECAIIEDKDKYFQVTKLYKHPNEKNWKTKQKSYKK